MPALSEFNEITRKWDVIDPNGTLNIMVLPANDTITFDWRGKVYITESVARIYETESFLFFVTTIGRVFELTKSEVPAAMLAAALKKSLGVQEYDDVMAAIDVDLDDKDSLTVSLRATPKCYAHDHVARAANGLSVAISSTLNITTPRFTEGHESIKTIVRDIGYTYTAALNAALVLKPQASVAGAAPVVAAPMQSAPVPSKPAPKKKARKPDDDDGDIEDDEIDGDNLDLGADDDGNA